MKILFISIFAAASLTACPSPKPDPLTGCTPYDLDCTPISDPPSPPDVT